MNTTSDADKICLQVFSKVSAAISHEIKNTLSIINENAGLLDDLAGMADEDMGLPPQRVQAAVSTIMKQVVRSNTIMKNLNRFAHSGDAPVSQADLYETLSLVVALSSRQAAMKKINVTVSGSTGGAINTFLFHLESLFFLILMRIYGCAREGSSLVITTGIDNDSMIIKFAIDDQGRIVPEDIPNTQESVLAEMVGAVCESDAGAIILTIPATINKDR